MTDTPALTAESEALVREQQSRVSGLPSGVLRDRLAAIEAAAIARDREGLVGRTRSAVISVIYGRAGYYPHIERDAASIADEVLSRLAIPETQDALARHVRDTGCEGLDWEQLRREKGWPTPHHMRRTADALDQFTRPARYGDVLRWVADLCDAALAAPAASPEDDESWRNEPLCCFSIHEFEQVCPRTGTTFMPAPATCPEACARCGCDESRHRTVGPESWCWNHPRCTGYQPATASAAAPAASPEWPPDVSCVHLPGHPDDCDECGCGAATASAAATSEEGGE